jgi:hypothetical protein
MPNSAVAVVVVAPPTKTRKRSLSLTRTSNIIPTTIYKFSLATGGGRNPLAR